MLIERSFTRAASLALALCVATAAAQAPPVATDPPQFGPYNGTFLADGPGLAKPIPNAHDPVLLADSPWSLFCWIKTSEPVDTLELVAGIGSTTAEYPRYLAIDAGRVRRPYHRQRQPPAANGAVRSFGSLQQALRWTDRILHGPAPRFIR